jgi:predicted transcriptional regulator
MAAHHHGMRTTVELTDRHRAKLLELAAERGEKGFSGILREALDRFLDEQSSRRDRVDEALKLRGSFSDSTADELEASLAQSRSYWR